MPMDEAVILPADVYRVCSRFIAGRATASSGVRLGAEQR